MKRKKSFSIEDIMNKKILIFILILLFVWSLEAEGFKLYSFKDEGYSGYAFATYMDYMPPLDVVEGLAERNEEYYRKQNSFIRYNSGKLSKQESFLLWSALNEYNYKNGEMYVVVIKQKNEYLHLFVIIIDEFNYECRFWGGIYTTKL